MTNITPYVLLVLALVVLLIFAHEIAYLMHWIDVPK